MSKQQIVPNFPVPPRPHLAEGEKLLTAQHTYTITVETPWICPKGETLTERMENLRPAVLDWHIGMKLLADQMARTPGFSVFRNARVVKVKTEMHFTEIENG